jgi:uncharacterized protein (DUF4415 family)
MKKASARRSLADLNKELAVLATRSDDQIDTRSIPEATEWSGAKRGLFYRPVKKQLTLRLDADVIAWFRDHASKGEGYQTNINSALREHVKRRTAKAVRHTLSARQLKRA